MSCFTNIFKYLSKNGTPNWDKWYGTCSSQKWNSFNNLPTGGKFGIDLVAPVCNTTLRTLESSNVCSQLYMKTLTYPNEAQIVFNYLCIRPLWAQMPKYIGKATTCTFYAILQNKMSLLILYNQNKMFVSEILKKTCHHP